VIVEQSSRVPAGGGFDGRPGTVLEAGPRLVEWARARGITVRLCGGVAFWLHCPRSRHIQLRRGRTIADVDLVAYFWQKHEVEALLTDLGYRPDPRVATVPGLRRSLFDAPGGAFHCDVFYDALAFCHVIDLRGRLRLAAPTLPLADLLLQKLQIVRLTEKDVQDVQALLAEHDLGGEALEMIDSGRIAALCARDWGLWRTVTGNLVAIRAATAVADDLAAPERAHITGRIDRLLADIASRPKGIAWKLRAVVGERWAWYEEVDTLEEAH
jgi:hypothetical protein